MRNFHFFICVILLTFAVSCGGGGSDGGTNEGSKEKLRVVHAAPTLGLITILQDEIPIVENLPYAVASDYIEIEEKAESVFSIKVNPEFVIPVLSVKEDVVSPYKKTLLVTESGGQPVLTFIGDQTETEIPSNESRIRFINAASIAESIDVYVTSPKASLEGRSPVVSALDFLSTSSYFPITPANYRIRIAVNTDAAASSSASDDTSDVPDIDFDSGDYPVDAGEEISFYLLESKGGGRPYRSLTAIGAH